jgi:hypothetical protein
VKVQVLIKALDDDEIISCAEYDGYLVWPTIRFLVLQYFIDKTNELDSARSSLQSEGLLTKIKAVLIGLRYFPFFGPKKPILIFNTATSNIRRENGEYFNRIVDYLFEADPSNTWKIEEPIGFKSDLPKTHKSYSKLLIIIYAELISRALSIFKPLKIKTAEAKISMLVDRINENLEGSGLSLNDKYIENTLVKHILKMRPYYNLYISLFKKKGVRKLIIEDGHYGFDKAILIKAAKDCSILVIEPQHGFVNENHPAYNYGEKVILNSVYKSYLPDIYLCYGKFWADNISIPNACYVMGNPHLENSLKKVEHVKSYKKILVLGSGVTISETQALLNKLNANKPDDYDLYYRPHPQERSDIHNRYGVQISQGIKIDNLDLYFSIAEAEIIIGELTTAIFEAIALNKVIYLFNSSYTKAYYNSSIKYFRLFSLSDVSVVFAREAPEKGGNEYYWEMDWKNSYSKLNNLLI